MRASDSLLTEVPQVVRCPADLARASPLLNADQRCQICEPGIHLDGIEGNPRQRLDDGSAVQRTAVAVATDVLVDIDFDLLFGIEKRHHHMGEMACGHDPAPLKKLLVVAPEPVGQH
ncbi:hypothetical protein D9M70_496190 [compost metagenome]